MNEATSAPFTPRDKRPCDASKDKGHSLQNATIANTWTRKISDISPNQILKLKHWILIIFQRSPVLNLNFVLPENFFVWRYGRPIHSCSLVELCQCHIYFRISLFCTDGIQYWNCLPKLLHFTITFVQLESNFHFWGHLLQTVASKFVNDTPAVNTFNIWIFSYL